MNKANFLKVFYFFIGLLLMWGGFSLYNDMTDGFSVREISSNPRLDGEGDIISIIDRETRDQIFSQTFRYMGKGCQFYAFESEDRKYVMKFFKQKHLRDLCWLNEIPFPHFLKHYVDKKVSSRKKRIQNLFTSCKIAITELALETGIVYLHLDHTNENHRLILYDKAGFKHKIDLSHCEFLIQKKGKSLAKTFEELLQEHNPQNIQNKIHQLANLIILRCEKGIRDKDPAFVQNVAFYQGADGAIFIDVGQFIKDESIKTDQEKKKDQRNRLNEFRSWSIKNYPELTQYIDKEIAIVN